MSNGAFKTATELRGLALPARRGPGGFFESKNPHDVAWGDLLVALFVPQGSRPMRRQFGSALYEYLFDPIAVEDETLEIAVRDTAVASCPHLNIVSVSIKNIDGARVTLGIVFGLKSDPMQTVERQTIVQKTDISVLGAA